MDAGEDDAERKLKAQAKSNRKVRGCCYDRI